MATSVETEGRKVVSEDFESVQVGSAYGQKVIPGRSGLMQAGVYTVHGTITPAQLAFTSNAAITLLGGIPGCVVIPEYFYWNYIEQGGDYVGTDQLNVQYSDGSPIRSGALLPPLFTNPGNKMYSWGKIEMYGTANPPNLWRFPNGNAAPYGPGANTAIQVTSTGGGGFTGGNSLLKYTMQFCVIPVS